MVPSLYNNIISVRYHLILLICLLTILSAKPGSISLGLNDNMGFFGGLSGHQGAMRSAFLASSQMSKKSFIGTGVSIACLVDITRISVYGVNLSSVSGEYMALMGAACTAAFFGVFIGQRVLEKVTMNQIRKIVGIGLILISIGLGSGII